MKQSLDCLRLDPPDLVRSLTETLGARLVALIGGAKDTRSVRSWSSGESAPRNLTRLQLAKQVIDVIATRDKADVIRAWFSGVNHYLDDENPALLIAHDGDNPVTAKRIIQAARAFVAE